MGIATHLGPWLLGTVKETTGPVTAAGAAAGLVRNTGLTTVAQTVKFNLVGAATAVALPVCALPAGAHIVNVIVDTLVTLSGTVTAATLTVGTATTADLYFPSTTILTAGRQAPTLTATQLTAYAGIASTASPNGVGVGPLDVAVIATPTFTTGSPSTAGIIQITITYLVANPDGSTFPASA
jgi:hypothetical protein